MRKCIKSHSLLGEHAKIFFLKHGNMYPRVEDFRIRHDDDDEKYDPERGLRRGNSRYSGSLIALLLLVWIIAATLFGGIVVVLTKENARATEAWMCKSGERGRL